MQIIQNYTMHMIVTGIVIVSAIAWIPYAIYSDSNLFLRIVCIIVGVFGCISLFNRNLYLPFLADCVLPSILLKVTDNTDKLNPEDIVVYINNLPPKVKVIWWAAENGDPRQRLDQVHWREAYGEFTNSGVTVSNANGVATVQLKCPQEYFVQRFILKQTLKKHIHYRYTLSNGMLSSVYTQDIKC